RPGLGMRHRAVPKGRLKIRTRCSAVPRGTVQLAYHYPGLRPGLLSDVPTGLSAEVLAQPLKAPLFLAPLRARLKSRPETKSRGICGSTDLSWKCCRRLPSTKLPIKIKTE